MEIAIPRTLLPKPSETVVPAGDGLKALPRLVVHVEPMGSCLAEESIALLYRRNESVIEARVDDIP
jgi:hypothetical protein